MEQAGAEFWQWLELKGRRKSHRLTVASDLRNHISPFFAGKTLDRVRPKDIERYVSAKRGTLAIKTVRNHVNTMHSIFDLGLRKGWCSSNPVKLADRPTLNQTETRIQFLEQAELEQLLAASYPDDAFGRIEPTLYLTAAMTGLRQGELLGLRWRDIDFDARKVRVVSPYVRGEFGDPKSAGSGRSVPMAERVADALRSLRSDSVYARDRDLVFCHPETGKPLDRSKLVRRFKQAIDRAEVHRITFHELRHTFGTRMAAAGTPMRTLQHWMGHADSKTTQISTPTTSRATRTPTRSTGRSRYVGLSWAEERGGNHRDAVGAPVGRGPGRDDDGVPKSVAELVSQPEELLGVRVGCGACELDLEGDNAAVARLDDEVDLVPAT
jgi:integrase